MIEQIKIKKARTATQLIFLVCGLGVASWAPMVPYAKERLDLNDADLGLLLLLLGAGAITMMPITGILTNRFGSRIVILCSSLLMAIVLPLLLLMDTVLMMGVCLFIFGAAVGTVDVAMNAHGVQVQNAYKRPVMSSLHGLFSVGGLLGSLGLGFLMKLGLVPEIAAVSISIVLVIIALSQYTRLFTVKLERNLIKEHLSETHSDTNHLFSWLKGSVIFLGLMCFAVFLSEGAMLDWSAVFLLENKKIESAWSGAGYAAFSIAMATMRLVGDKLVMRLDAKKVVVGGSLLAAFGLFIAIFTPWMMTALLGFVMLGLGAANIVPVFFSEGGRLKEVPPTVTIPAITTMGYAGQLAGPAILGFIAHRFSLSIALGFIALLLLMVAIAYGFRKKV